jgi:hypothetical protein
LRVGLSTLALLLAGSVHAQVEAGRTPVAAVMRATPGTQCVADPAYMRLHHMDLLRHQRDDTVRSGIRGGRFSLKDCIDCHASGSTQSVAQAPGDFCVACHRYAAVTIDCFECHSSRPRAVARTSP